MPKPRRFVKKAQKEFSRGCFRATSARPGSGGDGRGFAQAERQLEHITCRRPNYQEIRGRRLSRWPAATAPRPRSRIGGQIPPFRDKVPIDAVTNATCDRYSDYRVELIRAAQAARPSPSRPIPRSSDGRRRPGPLRVAGRPAPHHPKDRLPESNDDRGPELGCRDTRLPQSGLPIRAGCEGGAREVDPPRRGPEIDDTSDLRPHSASDPEIPCGLPVLFPYCRRPPSNELIESRSDAGSGPPARSTRSAHHHAARPRLPGLVSTSFRAAWLHRTTPTRPPIAMEQPAADKPVAPAIQNCIRNPAVGHPLRESGIYAPGSVRTITSLRAEKGGRVEGGVEVAVDRG